MQSAMNNATKVMRTTNKLMNPQKIAKKAAKFQRQQQKNELGMVCGLYSDDVCGVLTVGV